MKEQICLWNVMAVKTNVTAKWGNLRDHRCKGTTIAYKYKIFVAI